MNGAARFAEVTVLDMFVVELVNEIRPVLVNVPPQFSVPAFALIVPAFDQAPPSVNVPFVVAAIVFPNGLLQLPCRLSVPAVAFSTLVELFDQFVP
jgi:hypothetical protein